MEFLVSNEILIDGLSADEALSKRLQERDLRHKRNMEFRRNKHTRYGVYKAVLLVTTVMWFLYCIGVLIYSVYTGDDAYVKMLVRHTVVFVLYFAVFKTFINSFKDGLIESIGNASGQAFLVLMIPIGFVLILIPIISVISWGFN